MQTVIHSNGSKFYGENPDSIERLFEVMQTNKLAKFAEIIKVKNQNLWTIFGNFATVSHVFHIDTYDKALVNRFRRAFRKNKEL